MVNCFQHRQAKPFEQSFFKNIYLRLQEKNNCFTKTQGLYQWSTVFSTSRQSLLNRVSLKTFICTYRKKNNCFTKTEGLYQWSTVFNTGRQSLLNRVSLKIRNTCLWMIKPGRRNLPLALTPILDNIS